MSPCRNFLALKNYLLICINLMISCYGQPEISNVTSDMKVCWHMNETTSAPKLLTPADLSERYLIPKTTAAKWRWNGEGPPYVKLGKRVLYRETDVEAWLASKLRISTASAA